MEQTAWQALWDDFADLGDFPRLTHIAVRLLIAALLGGLLGYQRQSAGKAAGVRTHMLVALGAAMFVLVPQLEGMRVDDMSRVIQGVVTGIGFLGAGAILKLTDAQEIRGLTTAAGIWMTAAVGVAVGMGRLGSAILAAGMAYVVLDVLYRLEASDSQDKKSASTSND